MQLKNIELGVAVGRPAFRQFTITQHPDGRYFANVVYVLQTIVDGATVAESEVVNEMLNHEQVLAHPMFSTLYPPVQAFTRSVLAVARPDLVEQPA